jgi:hypothetical protein
MGRMLTEGQLLTSRESTYCVPARHPQGWQATSVRLQWGNAKQITVGGQLVGMTSNCDTIVDVVKPGGEGHGAYRVIVFSAMLDDTSTKGGPGTASSITGPELSNARFTSD